MKEALQFVGKPAQRVDGPAKVLGTARYLEDMQVPGMLYARVLRSSLPHARIVKLDVSAARQVPGVRAVITSEDYVDHGRFGRFMNDQFVLAYEKVRHVGEGIAAVAADTPEAAAAGMAAIVCELEPLPVLTDPERALDPDAVQVGPGHKPNVHTNLVVEDIVRKGDAAAGVAASPVRLERRYHTPHQDHAYLETEGALAIPSPDGSITVYSTDQSPFINLGILAASTGLPESKLRVIQPPVGGTFGGKNDLSYQATAQVAMLAIKSGCPVRLCMSREESAVASYMRDAMTMYVRLGAEADGRLNACHFDSYLDSGAYASGSYLTTWRAAMHAMGAYRYDSCDVSVKAVYTNNGYSGAFRGFGNTEVCFAIEQAIDELADQLGQDPIDLRLKNCVRLGDVTPHGQKLTEAVSMADCLNEVRRLSAWDEKRAAFANQDPDARLRRGLGVAAVFHGVSLGAEGVDHATSSLELNHDYSLSLSSGLTDYGQGSRTVFTLIAAETLGVRPERIRMYRPDTSTSFASGPTVASRATVAGGNAARLAAGNLGHLLKLAAADLLGCAVAQLGRVGEGYVGPSEEVAAFEVVVDHARQMGFELSVRTRWDGPPIDWNFEAGQGTPYYAYHYGAQVAEVEVDLDCGRTRVTDLWAVHDAGRVIFPQGALGQLIGGIAQGLGYALMEEVSYEGGYLQNLNFDSYLIPTALDMPRVHAVFLETDNSIGPYGAKNIAEPAMVPTAPAILNALAQALGRRIYDLPASLERVVLGRDLARPAADGLPAPGLALA